MSAIARAVFGVVYLILSAFTVTINSLLIASFVATKRSLEKTSNFLIVFLSISDCLNGAAAMPFLGLGMLFRCSTIDKLSHFAKAFLLPTQSFISMDLTMLIACDRYIHMNPDLNRESRLQKLFKKPRIYILIICIVILPIPFSTVEYLFGERNPVVRASLSASYSMLTFTTMSSLLVFYIRGYRRIRHFVAENPVYSNRGSTEEPEYVRELYKTVLILLIAMLVSFLPAFVLIVMTIVLPYTNRSFVNSNGYFFFETISLLFYQSNSFTNAMIIFYRNKKSKTWLAEKLFGFCCKTKSDAEIQHNARVICNMETSHM